jgi:hypothetical protein
MVPVLLMPFVAYLGLDWNPGPPLQDLSTDQCSSIVAMHALSVARLTAFVGLRFATTLSERNI